MKIEKILDSQVAFILNIINILDVVSFKQLENLRIYRNKRVIGELKMNGIVEDYCYHRDKIIHYLAREKYNKKINKFSNRVFHKILITEAYIREGCPATWENERLMRKYYKGSRVVLDGQYRDIEGNKVLIEAMTIDEFNKLLRQLIIKNEFVAFQKKKEDVSVSFKVYLEKKGSGRAFERQKEKANKYLSEGEIIYIERDRII